MTDPTTIRHPLRVGAARSDEAADHVAIEEPLSIQLDCNPLAVTMRTPGDDRELALGFLFSEGILQEPGQVARVVVSAGQGNGNDAEQLANVVPAAGASIDLIEAVALRRGTLTTSACGVCGRERIDDLVARCRPLEDGPRIAAEVLVALTAKLAGAQGVFDRTGGVHAAGVFSTAGELQLSREDIGRHNAVDKVVGALFQAGRAPVGRDDREALAVLVVSGRASFEIVQKAVMAGIPIVVSVSAASSLAIDLAEACNMTLAGFVRGGGGEVYAGRGRIVGGEA